MMRAKPQIDNGKWAKVGRKHHRHESGFEVIYDHNRWMWEVVGTDEFYPTLTVAQFRAEALVADRHVFCACKQLVQVRSYTDGTAAVFDFNHGQGGMRSSHRCATEEAPLVDA